MNARRRSFIRKIVYLCAILPLLFALSWLGKPATSGGEDREASPGGKLAKLRTKEDLDQSQWGEIDPAGEAIKLATFGMRGVAANLLWSDAIEAKKKKDWTKLSATLNQVVKLQPNFLKVWEFQAWNLSYNCSAEFDDYRDRYRWVIQGIKFLEKGIDYNKLEPRLYQKTGWTISQKIGRSDEKKQFRELFVEDDEFHGDRPKSERDNWLVGKEWYGRAADLIDNKGRPLYGDSPLIFRSKAPMCQMNYAESLEKDGTFGEKARKAWGDALEDWDEYGEQDIPYSDNTVIHLGEQELLEEQLKKLSDELDALAPGAREELKKVKFENLTDEQRVALNTPAKMRDPKQARLAYEAEALVQVSFDEVYRQAAENDQKKAKELLDEIKQVQLLYSKTKSYRGIVNYDYWGLRAKLEQDDDMLNARKLSYQAQKFFKEGGNLLEAGKAFEGSIQSWANVLKNNELLLGSSTVDDATKQEALIANNLLMTDKATNDDLDDLIEQYGKVLDQEDAMFPADFPLDFYIRARVQQSDKINTIVQAAAKAQAAIDEENWVLAKESFENELGQWTLLMADIPSLMQGSDMFTVGHVLSEIKRYADVLEKLGEPFPDSFSLRQFVWGQVEHDRITQEARGTYYAAKEASAQKDYAAAEKLFAQSVGDWEQVLEKYPSIAGDKTICREIVRTVGDYLELLETQGKTLPEKMPLKKIIDRWGRNQSEAED